MLQPVATNFQCKRDYGCCIVLIGLKECKQLVTCKIQDGIDFVENWWNSARVEGRDNLGVIFYFDLTELKFGTLIGLGTKQEYTKFGINCSNGSCVPNSDTSKMLQPIFSVSAISVVVSSWQG